MYLMRAVLALALAQVLGERDHQHQTPRLRPSVRVCIRHALHCELLAACQSLICPVGELLRSHLRNFSYCRVERYLQSASQAGLLRR
eukprot:c2187_g2_i1 orf=2-259(-)